MSKHNPRSFPLLVPQRCRTDRQILRASFFSEDNLYYAVPKTVSKQTIRSVAKGSTSINSAQTLAKKKQNSTDCSSNDDDVVFVEPIRFDRGRLWRKMTRILFVYLVCDCEYDEGYTRFVIENMNGCLSARLVQLFIIRPNKLNRNMR